MQIIKNRTKLNQTLIRKSSNIKKFSYIKKSFYLKFVDIFLKKKSSKISLTRESIFLIYGILTECGKIRPRTQKYNLSMKKYKVISKLIKRAREFKIIPAVYTISI